MRTLTPFAMVPRMADEHAEPGEVTDRFRAFAEKVDPAPSKALPIGMIAAIAVAVVAVIAVVWILASS